MAATISKNYFCGWKNWVDWSSIKQGVISCPADPFYVTTYHNHVLFMSVAKGSIILAVYGIRWSYHVIGFNCPTENPFAELAFEGCQRLCETETTKNKHINSDMIKALITKYGEKNFSIFINMFLEIAGFLRMEELLDVKLNHIKI